MGKKKRPNSSAVPTANTVTASLDGELSVVSEGTPETPTDSQQLDSSITVERTHCFKNSKWLTGRGIQAGSSGGNVSKRTKSWKSLKQIASSERSQQIGIPGSIATIYGSLEAGPSTRHAKKYSDISGLLSNYTDPETKLRYSNAKEFRKIRLLSPDLVQGYLNLRRANLIV